MQKFTQYAPTEVIFGKDTELQTGAEVKKWGGTRALIVFGGQSAKKSGLLDRVEESLTQEGIQYTELGGVKPNPRLSLVEKGIAMGIDFQTDFILAVGGGSAIDSAKAIAHGVANPDYRIWEDIWMKKVPLTKSTPVGVVLTLSAAGSEMSDSAVITNEELKRKAGLNTVYNRVKFAVMNPELTYTLPKYQLACGIVDIMMHTLERYFTPVHGNQLTDEIAEGLLRVMIENGPKAMENQTDYDAMSEIMWCGSISHNNMTELGRMKDMANHKMGHELSAKYDVTHGASLSALWGSWAHYVYQIDIPRFAHYAKKVWGIEEPEEEKAALAGIQATVDFFQSLDMPTSIGQLEIGVLPEEELNDMAQRCTAGDTMKVAVFKPLGAADVLAIYQAANH